LEDIITYAFTYFSSPIDQPAELWLGTHEDIKVFINGNEVYSFSGINVYGDDDLYTNIIDINIREGENTLMVKTLNKYNDYSFALNICEVEDNSNYAGNRIPGLKFYTTSQDTGSTEPSSVMDLITSESVRCYPNPVKDYTIIEFNNPVRARVRINIYDLSGKHIKCLSDELMQAGIHRFIWKVDWESNYLKKGMYICTIKSGTNSYNLKILLE
jgi:hypothetical protein